MLPAAGPAYVAGTTISVTTTTDELNTGSSNGKCSLRAAVRLANGAAIDAVTNNDCPSTDQRGVARPQDGNRDGFAACDIGAYERLGGTVNKP